MEDNEIILFMIEAFNKENYDLCERAGMTPDQIQTAMDQSKGSIEFMMNNVFYKMKQQGYIV
jgi:3-hydroxyisobutyrate dehydrogenase-like beta-hydroxyacid dehydrogenase